MLLSIEPKDAAVGVAAPAAGAAEERAGKTRN